MYVKRYNFFLLPLILLTVFNAFGQKISSPYSRYGIGDIYASNNTITMSLGGSGLALKSPYMVNYLNPASYAGFDTLSFVFEGGMASKFVTLKTTSLSQNSNFATMSNLLFGFPFSNWWKGSIGLVPFSQMGYHIAQSEYDSLAGNMKKVFNGNGGLNQFYFGNAFRLSKNLSVGANISYLFGSLDKTRALTFPDSVYRFSFRVINSTYVGDFYMTYGIQYHTKIGSNYKLGAGFTYSNASDISARETRLSETYTTGSTGIIYIKDTIELFPDRKGDIHMPEAYGFGLCFEKQNHWLLLADFQMQDWGSYSFLGEKDSLKNSYQASLGFQYTPDERSITSYLAKVSYRAGFRYSRTYLQLRNTQLGETAFSFGAGFPLLRSRSRLNVGFEIGKRGTVDNDLIQENFFKLTVGVSVFERWFIRRRFE